jgi:hypothetical protein
MEPHVLGYSLFQSLGKHFRRLSIMDRLMLLSALWFDLPHDGLNEAQFRFLEKVKANTSGCRSSLECEEDRNEILRS